METRDIMIGDFFSTKTTDGEIFYGRVESIGCLKDAYIEGWFVRLYNNDRFCDTTLNKLIPISLTREIMELNGFDTDCYKTKVVRGGKLSICLLKNIPMYFYSKTWHYCFPQPKYVHQLQHILRICGQNSFADNFKVDNKTME